MRSQYARFMKELGAKSVHVKTFCEGMEDALSRSGENAINFPAMILEPMNGRYTDNRVDNPLNIIRGGFSIVIPAEPTDSAAINAALDNSFAIGAMFIAKINSEQSYALPDFDPDKVEWEEVGPVLDACYGILFTFPTVRAASLEVDPNDWKE